MFIANYDKWQGEVGLGCTGHVYFVAVFKMPNICCYEMETLIINIVEGCMERRRNFYMGGKQIRYLRWTNVLALLFYFISKGSVVQSSECWTRISSLFYTYIVFYLCNI